jgi:hypothetical protein
MRGNHMTEDKEARLLELLKESSEEKNGDKLIKLTDEILRLLEEMQQKNKGQNSAA